MTSWINRQFGTWRGLVRLLLAYAELATGRLSAIRLHRPEAVRRLVFVCLGNICRSAYAHRVAAAQGLPVASLGLSTFTGGGSPEQALAAAARQQVDMHPHRSVDWEDFETRPGDLFLVMEVRQAHELRRRLGERTDVQVCLLGMWCSPSMPHLHDPFTLSDAYFDSCFRRVAEAVCRLGASLPALARRSPAEEVDLRRIG
jgi:protein-tyrosine phosphatase